MDIFLEYMVKRKKTFIDVIKIIGIILVCELLIVAIVFIVLTYFPSIAGWLFVFIGILIYFGNLLVTMLNVEYEYSFINGDIDVDVIMNKKNRRRLVTLNSKTLSICEKVGAESAAVGAVQDDGALAKTIFAGSRRNSEGLYYAVFFADGKKVRLIFEPNMKMLEALKKYNPDKVFI